MSRLPLHKAGRGGPRGRRAWASELPVWRGSAATFRRSCSAPALRRILSTLSPPARSGGNSISAHQAAAGAFPPLGRAENSLLALLWDAEAGGPRAPARRWSSWPSVSRAPRQWGGGQGACLRAEKSQPQPVEGQLGEGEIPGGPGTTRPPPSHLRPAPFPTAEETLLLGKATDFRGRHFSRLWRLPQLEFHHPSSLSSPPSSSPTLSLLKDVRCLLFQ